jgi:hypothetical protein
MNLQLIRHLPRRSLQKITLDKIHREPVQNEKWQMKVQPMCCQLENMPNFLKNQLIEKHQALGDSVGEVSDDV